MHSDYVVSFNYDAIFFNKRRTIQESIRLLLLGDSKGCNSNHKDSNHKDVESTNVHRKVYRY